MPVCAGERPVQWQFFENWGRTGFDGGSKVHVARRGIGGLLKNRKNTAANNNVEYAIAA